MLEKLSQKAARYDRSTPKGRIKAEAMDAIAEELGALDVWTRVPPNARSPKLTRERLAAAAVRLADAEGIDIVEHHPPVLAVELVVAPLQRGEIAQHINDRCHTGTVPTVDNSPLRLAVNCCLNSPRWIVLVTFVT